jgi:hypothetical protein
MTLTTQLHQSPIAGGCRRVYSDLPKILGKRLYKNLHPEFLLHLREQQEDPIMMVRNKACEGKLPLILALCLYKQASKPKASRGIHIQAPGWGSPVHWTYLWSNQLSFKQQLVTTWVQALTFNRETDRAVFCSKGFRVNTRRVWI